MHMVFSFLVFCLLYRIAVCVDCNVEPKTKEGRLRKFLFCDYDKSNRPTIDDSATIVKIKMILKGFEFDDSSEKLTISSWMAMIWTDDHLKWTPAEHNSLNQIIESSSLLWQPELSLYNSDVASSQINYCAQANCVIDYKGKVSCIPPCTHTAKCTADYSRWPFDTQNCSLHMGSWVHSGEDIDFSPVKTVIPETDLQSQTKQWKLLTATYKRNPGNYSISKKTYPSLTYTFTMERHSIVHATMLLAPAMTFMVIDLLALWLSPACPQRLILYCMSLFSHFMYMQQLTWYVPSNGDSNPELIIFFRDSMIITAFLLVNTVIVRGIMLCGVTVPPWLQSTTGFMDTNKIGQMFLFKTYLIENQPLHTENAEEAGNLEEDSKTNDKEKQRSTVAWQTFAKIIDRSMFVIILLLYFFMITNFIPQGYLTRGKNTGDITVIGY